MFNVIYHICTSLLLMRHNGTSFRKVVSTAIQYDLWRTKAMRVYAKIVAFFWGDFSYISGSFYLADQIIGEGWKIEVLDGSLAVIWLNGAKVGKAHNMGRICLNILKRSHASFPQHAYRRWRAEVLSDTVA